MTLFSRSGRHHVLQPIIGRHQSPCRIFATAEADRGPLDVAQILQFCALAPAGMARGRTWLPLTSYLAGQLGRGPADGLLTTEDGTRSRSPDQGQGSRSRLRCRLRAHGSCSRGRCSGISAPAAASRVGFYRPAVAARSRTRSLVGSTGTCSQATPEQRARRLHPLDSEVAVHLCHPLHELEVAFNCGKGRPAAAGEPCKSGQ